MTTRFDEYLPFGKPSFTDEEIEAVTRTMKSGWVGQGKECQRFEKELAEYCGAKEAVLVNSCTSALFLCLKELGIGPGDEVICPSVTWYSTANVALYLGAKAVFADIDPNTLCLDPLSVKSALTDKTRAVVCVHLGGLAVSMTELRSVLPDSVAIVEDAAHAIEARYTDGGKVGGSGNLTCFSFYANKNLSTAEGGAILLNDSDLANRFRCLRLHALNIDAWKRFSNPKSVLISAPLGEIGYKMNYTDMQASIGRVQLKRLPQMAERRLEIATVYRKRLEVLLPGAKFQTNCLSKGHARHLLLWRLPVKELGVDRDDFVLKLRDRNVGASVHYTPLHWMPLYESKVDLPVTEEIFKEIVTLPISSSMSLEDAERVVKAIEEVLEEMK